VTKKKRLVISAVNCVEGGILSVLQDCVESVCAEFGATWEIIILANKRSLVPNELPKVWELPTAKKSWTMRLIHEWFFFHRLSRRLEPDVWLSLHDISPRVRAARRIVYCHNATPFYPLKFRDVLMDWKLGAFALLYGSLYAINIHSNDYVIVQQEWLRGEFRRRYGLNNIIVAHPANNDSAPLDPEVARGVPTLGRFRFCYPLFPRVFKNAELLCEAVRILRKRGRGDFEVVLTLDGTENSYARCLRRRYGGEPNISFVGRLGREQINQLYRSSDCLVFPSKLETWGLPISEFKVTGRPMLISDLPYAHETVGNYRNAAYFDPYNPEELADSLEQIMSGRFKPAPTPDNNRVPPPFASNWSELWRLLLED
jgi:glycosyltransferase involved in cell wall biosynthesis